MQSRIQTLHIQAQQFLQNKQYQQAHAALINILQEDKFFADGYFLLGIIASDHHNNAKAIQLFEQALKLSVNNPEYLAQLAKHYAMESDDVAAKKYADLACKYVSDSALTLDTIGVAYSKIGLHQQAIKLFEKATQLVTNNEQFYFNLGVAQTFTGNFEGAKTSHQKAITLAPHFSKSYTALSSYGGVNSDIYNIEVLKELFDTVTSPDDKLHIGHALAREYESKKEYDLAFKYLSLAKNTKLGSIDYDFLDDKHMFDSLMNMFSENPERTDVNPQGFDNDEAIFIVGMPRSGTTLVERILSQHSDVSTAGELEHFGLLLKKLANTQTARILDEETILAAEHIDYAELGERYINSTRVLTGTTAKFVDKMPLNVLYVAYILRALPKAKIVCLDRNPLDTIVSNFRQLFSANTYNYNYAYELETTANYYSLFNKLVETWKQNYPENFYQINYQKLVESPESEAKKLIGFCGLSWQEECLQTGKNKAPVATASAVQVREPINNKSVDNWKKYEAYLDQVKKIIAER